MTGQHQAIDKKFRVYRVWDKPTRIFHWTNVLCIVALIFIGLIMVYKRDLGITELDAKIKIKTLHVWIGYLFSINLTVRLLWGIVGTFSARLTRMKPSLSAIMTYRKKVKAGEQPQYLYHNPLGSVAVLLMMLLLVVVMFSGLFRAGTDIYYPPFGGLISNYIAQAGVDGATIKPYDVTGVDEQKLAKVKPVKSLAGKIHLYGAYALLLIIFLHIIGVVMAERKHQPGLVSAMISGNKPLSQPPEDGDEASR